MATKGVTISNSKTGERITWIETAQDTGGSLLKFQFSVRPRGRLPVVHLHPRQQETFEITKGIFCIKIREEIRTVKPGDIIIIEKGVPHQWWNPSEQDEAEMIITFTPALNTETFLEQFCGLGNDNLTKPDGTPCFLQLMTMVNAYDIYIAGPPLIIQKMMGYVLGGIAGMLGYKKYHEKYSSTLPPQHTNNKLWGMQPEVNQPGKVLLDD